MYTFPFPSLKLVCAAGSGCEESVETGSSSTRREEKGFGVRRWRVYLFHDVRQTGGVVDVKAGVGVGQEHRRTSVSQASDGTTLKRAVILPTLTA
jgi:hypothetical protein